MEQKINELLRRIEALEREVALLRCQVGKK